MPTDLPVPETRVLAIASHVVYGYVGNTMATFVMQSLGCEVAALNTVHFSNHAGYRQLKGTKSTGQEISSLYEGLRQSDLADFDVLLSGYAPSAAAVEAVGLIAADLKKRSAEKPGSFFWVLDPVMGDKGRLYVSEDVVPVYKRLAPQADLILPNQFEAEVLSGVTISSLTDLAEAIKVLHHTLRVPHVIVTSLQLPLVAGAASSSSSSFSAQSATTTADTSSTGQDESSSSSRSNNINNNMLAVVGSTMRSDGSPRLFKIDVPQLDCFFSGTGDMFAGLTVARLREEVYVAGDYSSPSASSSSTAARGTTTTTPRLRDTPSWVSPDHIAPTDLPLARAVEKVLASMHDVLERTLVARNEELARVRAEEGGKEGSVAAAEFQQLPEEERKAALEKREHLKKTKAAEVRVVRNAGLLQNPVTRFKTEEFVL